MSTFALPRLVDSSSTSSRGCKEVGFTIVLEISVAQVHCTRMGAITHNLQKRSAPLQYDRPMHLPAKDEQHLKTYTSISGIPYE
eukprot:6324198-Amphidinium_carterae.1